MNIRNQQKMCKLFGFDARKMEFPVQTLHSQGFQSLKGVLAAIFDFGANLGFT